MGLTLHYRLHAASESARAARELVGQLRDCALRLSFADVGPIETIARSRLREPDGESPLWLDSIEMLCRGEDYYDVPPLRGCGFFVDPDPGCETAAFGLAEYPKTILLPNRRRLRTGLTGWSWRSFCKTQYASNPRHGGFENFRRCHVSLVELLDAAADMGFQTRIVDESDYATHRDLARLRQEVGEWNELIAGLAGELKDSFASSVDAPITAFPNFEHLEASGRTKIR